MLSKTTRALVLLALVTAAMPVCAVQSTKDELIANNLPQVQEFVQNYKVLNSLNMKAKSFIAFGAASLDLTQEQGQQLSDMLNQYIAAQQNNQITQWAANYNTQDLIVFFNTLAKAHQY